MRRYLFADEAGCLTFRRGRGISTHFIICTVQMDPALGTAVLDLRRDLAWRGIQLESDQFHCTTDLEEVRQEMFALIADSNIRVDATIFEKSKTMPHLRPDENRFYHYAWYYHFKHVGPRIVKDGDELMIHTASIGTKKKRRLFLASINDVAQQVLQTIPWKCSFWGATSDPCLQVTDYCAWAIQRATEPPGDSRRMEQIKSKIRSAFHIFAAGNKHYF